jgi:hypothetical protein
MKAFDLGGHGYVESVIVSNPDNINLTNYAVGDARDLYVTIINKTHDSTKDSADAVATIRPGGLKPAHAAFIRLAGDEPGNAESMTATLGGAKIPNDGPWRGRWAPLAAGTHGEIRVVVPATTAIVVRIQSDQ